MGWKISAFHLIVALVPLAAYFLLLGLAQLRRHPFLTNGSRDLAALGLGLIGFVAIGPMELFLPAAAAYQFGPYIWLLMILLYLLLLAMAALVTAPRLVVYNATLDQIRPVLADVVFRLDVEARWAGECVSLPNLGVQFHVTASPFLRSVQLVAVGNRQNYDGWKRLERAMAPRLRHVPATRHSVSWLLLSLAGALLAVSVASVMVDPRGVRQSMWETLRFPLLEQQSSPKGTQSPQQPGLPAADVTSNS
jgi:hypothetical protein